MSGVDTVSDEFEVGFNKSFEARWYRAEQAGRVLMVIFTLAAGLGFLGRGPFSHASVRPGRAVPVRRHHRAGLRPQQEEAA